METIRRLHRKIIEGPPYHRAVKIVNQTVIECGRFQTFQPFNRCAPFKTLSIDAFERFQDKRFGLSGVAANQAITRVQEAMSDWLTEERKQILARSEELQRKK